MNTFFTETLETLDLFKRGFDFLGFPTSLIQPSPATPFPLLVADVRSDFDGPGILLNMAFTGDILSVTHPSLDMIPALANELKFTLHTSFAVPAERQADLCQFLMVLNPLLPVGAYRLDAEGELSLNYGLQSEKRKIAPMLVVRVARLLGFFFELNQPYLIRLITAESNYAETVERFEQEFGKVLPGAGV
jgi:hypothetical protein